MEHKGQEVKGSADIVVISQGIPGVGVSLCESLKELGKPWNLDINVCMREREREREREKQMTTKLIALYSNTTVMIKTNLSLRLITCNFYGIKITVI